ncbi:MAG: glycoside hydrolase family 20 zincin-like fold domain-containing protein, partial [Chloroflexi bacterium]|nr:glycoside hydrolase family 20 zincin-like fold domain-containing protein [Chloroflexota bacterium]
MHQPLPIIPKPDSVTFQAGFFVIDTNAAVSSPPGAERAADLIQKLTGLASIAHQGQIRFVLKPTIRGEEAYHLDVDESGIEIRASSTAGLLYGAQTLRQLLPAG